MKTELLRRIPVFAFASFTFLSAAAAAQRPERNLYDDGRAAYERGDFISALGLLTAYVERDPVAMRIDAPFATLVTQAVKDCRTKLETISKERSSLENQLAQCRGPSGVARVASNLTISTELPPTPPNMQPDMECLALFQSFAGEWIGEDDGKKCGMSIEVVNQRSPALKITMKDQGGQPMFLGIHEWSSPAPGYAHVLRNVKLRPITGGEDKHYAYLLLHTWDKSYLSGVSLWRGREFGASFKRMATASAVFEAHPASRAVRPIPERDLIRGANRNDGR